MNPEQYAVAAGSSPGVSTYSDPAYDKVAMLDRFGGDMELVNEIVTMFLDDCPRRLSALRRGLDAADGHSVELAAHSLKGSVSFFEAPAAVAAAQALETMGREGNLMQAEESWGAIEREITRLVSALEQLMAGNGAG